jgi:hypothetical protein
LATVFRHVIRYSSVIGVALNGSDVERSADRNTLCPKQLRSITLKSFMLAGIWDCHEHVIVEHSTFDFWHGNEPCSLIGLL